ncbi:hypothetical protein [Arcanobacterium haemolyticum]
MRKTRLALAMMSAASLTLAGCAHDSSVPEPEVAKSASNIVPQKKYAMIASDVAEALKQADQNRDAGALGPRIAGPFRVQREAEYALARATETTAPTSVVIDPKESALSSGSAFPRSFMAIDMTKTGRGIGTITVWQQPDARQNYQLWAAMDMFPAPPKIEIVNTKNDKPGYPETKPSEYSVDPATVLDSYVAYINARAMGDVKFNEGDPLYKQTEKQAHDLTAALNELGEAKIAFTVPNKDIRAISTKDGGLVMVGELRYNMTVTRTKDRATLKLGSSIGALAEGKKDGIAVVDKPVVAQYSTSVAFYIPPKGSKDPIHVLGGSVPALLSVTKAE